MADAREKNVKEEGSAAAVAEPRTSPDEGRTGSKKKKKKRRGCGFFIILLLLAAGIAAGLQASGTVDLRPYAYPIVPKIPYVGKEMSRLLAIPSTYAMTADERRAVELGEWETRIAESIRSMDEREKDLNALSDDLSAKEKTLEDERQEIAARIEALSRDMAERNAAVPGTAASGGGAAAALGEIVRTFQDMSPRNAAAILEKLDDDLAVSILDGVPQDTRGTLLARMDADRAARLTEQLTDFQKRKTQR
ncbi:MAG: MgtE intracellular region [Synergistaceae bacterium]|jgi:flagellar motility protein MotE (MotC chaperone)|nr:MgtE intracellular region [Synergistaceae bacterium]